MKDIETIRNEIGSIKWYHSMKVPGTELVTPGHSEVLSAQWQWSTGILEEMNSKATFQCPALDIACRDGMFSFWLEDHGVTDITSLDSNITEGIHWMKAIRGSKIHIVEQSCLDLEPNQKYNTVLFFGVLYHLRYPFKGISAVVHATKEGGLIVVETGVYKPNDLPLLYCPVDSSPWDATSCSFFNVQALDETFLSFGCKREGEPKFFGLDHPHVDRGLICYRKCLDTRLDYWEGIHRDYSSQNERNSDVTLRVQKHHLLSRDWTFTY